jgi:hypothetical protein
MMKSRIPSEPVAEKPGRKEAFDPRRLSMPLVALGLIVLLINGIRYGYAQDWMKMSLLLFGAFLNVLFGASFLLARGLNDLSTRLEVHLEGKRQAPSPESPWGKIAEVTAPVVLLVLAIAAGYQGRWLAFGLYLAACGSVQVLSFTLWAYIRICECLDRLWLKGTGPGERGSTEPLACSRP